MKKMLMVSVLFLSACSSPPKPPQVDWKQNPETVNTQLMDWQPTYSVIKSDEINSSWDKIIYNFKAENRFYDDSVFYAVAHSERIVVSASSADGYWIAKDWLRKNGAAGVIEYQPLKTWLNKSTVSIYFSRIN
ncbi:TPA: cag pathogenicity island Cag12 family protein [Salmonella enterica subsp. enterica serovar Chester]